MRVYRCLKRKQSDSLCRWERGITERLLLALFVVLCVWSLPMMAQPVSLLYTGHLNPDCYQDTIYGRQMGQRTWLPDRIVWGRTDIHQSQPCDDEPGYGSHPAGAPRFPVTNFVYPAWVEAGSVSFDCYNTNDSLVDMVFFLWGTASPGSTVRDTGRALVIYGQLALDTIKTIYVGTIDSAVQHTPFFAGDLGINRELVHPAVRDMSGVRSYELLRTTFPVTSSELPHLPFPLGETSTAHVSIYPNPAELWAQLQSEPLEAGEYTLTVLAVNGREYHRQTVHLVSTQQVERELDLSKLPNGYYVVRLHREGQVISSSPIVIVR